MAAPAKLAQAADRARSASQAAMRIAVACERGELPTLEDAKVLEAAGSYARKLITKEQP